MIKLAFNAALLGGLCLSAAPSLAYTDVSAGVQINRAWQALGHPDGAPSERRVTAEIAGEAWMLEQSGTLDGGWIRLDQSASLRLDLTAGAGEVIEARAIPAWGDTPYGQFQIRFDAVGAAAHWPTPDGAGRWTPAPSSSLRSARRYRDLFPESLLLDAAAADDLRIDSDGDLHFTRQTASADEAVELHFDPGSDVPTGFTISTSFPDDIFLTVWGEVEIVGEYGFWWRTEDGQVLPRQLALTLDGRPWQRFELNTFSLDPESGLGELAVPEEGSGGPSVRAIDDFPFSTRHESPAEGVQVYYGAWNVMAVEFPDGVYVFDAPISAGYSRQILTQIARDFPDRPVRGVITTSNAWPHMAGLSAYADAGIPIHLHPDNEALVRVALGEQADQAELRIVAAGDQPVSGPDGFALYPARGPALHGMMFATLPGRGLVWGSDALQLNRDSATPQPHARQYVAEFLASTCEVDGSLRALAMHQGPVAVSDLRAEFDSDSVPPCHG